MILEGLITFLLVGLLLSWRLHDSIVAKLKKDFEINIRKSREDAVKHSRSVIEGQVFEQLVPHFPEWNHTPSDARFLGSPLDFVVFDGLHEDYVKEVIFVEVKTGNSKVTKRQRSVRKAIREGRVKYELLELKNARK